MNWILCFTLFFPLQDFHEREHKSEAAQSGEGFVHLRLQGEKIFANLHPIINLPTQVNPHTGDWSHWNSLMENYVPPDIRLKEIKLFSLMLLYHQSNQLRQHPDSQREQHQDRLPRGQLCQVILISISFVCLRLGNIAHLKDKKQ